MNTIRDSGIIVTGPEPIETAPVDAAFPKLPYDVCYPIGQFGRFMSDVATDEDLSVNTGIAPEFAREITADVVGACGRVCTNSCRLPDVVAANNSPLDVELGIPAQDQAMLSIVGSYLDTSFDQFIDPDETRDDIGANYVQNVIEVWLDARYTAQEDNTSAERPTVESNAYRGLGNYTNMNFHVIKAVVDRLVKIGLAQQVAGVDAAQKEFGAVLENPATITAQDIKKYLLSLGKDYGTALNLSSTPRSEIFG